MILGIIFVTHYMVSIPRRRKFFLSIRANYYNTNKETEQHTSFHIHFIY